MTHTIITTLCLYILLLGCGDIKTSEILKIQESIAKCDLEVGQIITIPNNPSHHHIFRAAHIQTEYCDYSIHYIMPTTSPKTEIKVLITENLGIIGTTTTGYPIKGYNAQIIKETL